FKVGPNGLVQFGLDAFNCASAGPEVAPVVSTVSLKGRLGTTVAPVMVSFDGGADAAAVPAVAIPPKTVLTHASTANNRILRISNPPRHTGPLMDPTTCGLQPSLAERNSQRRC